MKLQQESIITNQHSLRTGLLAGSSALALVLAPAAGRGADLVWTNTAGGNWATAANWSPNQVPGGGDNAYLTNSGVYAVTISANAAVANLALGSSGGALTLNLQGGTFTLNGPGTGNANVVVNLTGGTVAGAGMFRLAGPLNWTNGTITGTVQCNGGSLGGSAAKYLTGGLLINTGPLTLATQPAYPFYTGSGSVISNLAGATLDFVTDIGTSYSGQGTRGTIYNAGLVRKSAGTATSQLNDTLNNLSTGTVEADSGILSLVYAGNYSGTNAANGSAILDFGGGTHNLNANCWFAGNGTIRCSAATISVNGPSSGGASLAFWLTGGTLAGPAALTLAGPLNWTNGTITGVVQCGGGIVGGSYLKYLTGGVLINSGTLTMATPPGYSFYTGSSSVISNLAGATLDFVTDTGTTYRSPGANGTIHNAGLLRKSAGTGTATLNDTLNNLGTGTVEADSGILSLAYGGTNSGRNTAHGVARLDFGGGTHLLDSNSLLDGNGTIGCSGGTVNFSGGSTLTGTTLLNGGTLNCSNAAPAVVGVVVMTSGTVGGNGLLVASGGLNWTNGTITGTVQCNGGSLGGSAAKYLTGGLLINTGPLTLATQPAYPLYTGSGSVISNLAGATLDFVTDIGTTYSGQGTRGTIYNAGLVRKSAGTATSQLNDTLNNLSTGTVEADSGILSLVYAGNYSGTNAANGSAILDFGGGTHNLNANCWFAGNGTIRCSAATISVNGPSSGGASLAFWLTGGTLAGPAALTLAGPLNWTNGTITGVVQCGGGIVGGSYLKYLTGGVLINSGTLTMATPPGYSFYTGSSSVISNLAGATLDFVTDVGTTYHSPGANGTIHNAGLLRKSAGTGTSTLNDIVTNVWTVETDSGTLELAQPFNQSAGQTLLLKGGLKADSTFTLTGGSLSGTNTLVGSVFNSGGRISLGSLAGVLSITGNYTETAAAVFELNGTVTAAGFGRLAVGNSAFLSGTLNANLVSPFYPPANTNYVFLTANSCGGTFGAFNYPSNLVGLVPYYTTGSAGLVVTNTRPVLGAIPDQFAAQQVPFTLGLAGYVTDADLPPQAMTYAVLSAPQGLGINSSSGLISWTPALGQGPSTNTVVVTVTDTAPRGVPAFSATNSFHIIVAELPPVLNPIADRTIHAGIIFSTTATASDPNQPTNTLTFGLVSGPSGMTVDAASGLISWPTSDAQANTTNAAAVKVTLNATPALSATQGFNVIVRPRPLLQSLPGFVWAREDDDAFGNESWSYHPVLTWSSISNTQYRIIYGVDAGTTNWSGWPVMPPPFTMVPAYITATGATTTVVGPAIGTKVVKQSPPTTVQSIEPAHVFRVLVRP